MQSNKQKEKRAQELHSQLKLSRTEQLTPLVRKMVSKNSFIGKKIYKPELSGYEILVLEKLVDDIILPNKLSSYSDKQLATMFHIDIRYVEETDLQPNLIAVIKPTIQKEFNAVIITRATQKYVKNSIMPEVVTYLLNKNQIGEIDREYKRFKGKVNTVESVKKETLARMLSMPRNEMKKIISYYDSNRDKIDAERYIFEISKHYNVSEQDVIERFHEIRKLTLTGTYFSVIEVTKKTDFSKQSQELKDFCMKCKTLK